MLISKYLKPYYKKFGLLFLIGFLTLVYVDYIQLDVPKYLGQLITYISNTKTLLISDVTNIFIELIKIYIILYFGRLLLRFCLIYPAFKIENLLRHDMFKKALALSQSYYNKEKVGNIMSWFSSDLPEVNEFLSWGYIQLIDAIFLGSLTILKMAKLNLFLTSITTLLLCSLIIWGSMSSKTHSLNWHNRQKSFDNLYDFVQESFSGIRVIKAFAKELSQFITFKKIAKHNKDKNFISAFTFVKFEVTLEVVIALIFFVINLVGAFMIYKVSIGSPLIIFNQQINLTPGQLVEFIGYSDILIWPMIASGQIIQMYSRAKTSMNRIDNFLDQNIDIKDSKDAIEISKPLGNIKISNLCFKYDDSINSNLYNINLEIKKGEIVGIVGKVGSGKTTFVNCLMRVFNVEPNCIFIDGYDIMDIKLTNLREIISYVPQDSFLFSSDIKQNIAFSNKDRSITDISYAASFASIDTDISSLKDKYDTVVGEKGFTLSGGQKQRISIARAFIKDSPIMILDDSVSAVDIKTEKTILNNICKDRKDKTTIVIASRISTVMNMDKVIIFEEGKVVGFDKPSNLLLNSKQFKEMYELQKLED